MDVEVITAIGGVVAAAGAVGAWVVAMRANRRADAANVTAERALDLQSRIDAREREYRAVRWKGEWDLDDAGRIVFRLTNTGHTPACSVTAVVTRDGDDVVRELGDVAAGAHGDVRISTQMTGQAAVEVLRRQDTPFEVHWSSPLGAPKTYRYPGLQLY